jgi:hypothetical protein
MKGEVKMLDITISVLKHFRGGGKKRQQKINKLENNKHLFKGGQGNRKAKQEVLGRTNSLLSFDTARTA